MVKEADIKDIVKDLAKGSSLKTVSKKLLNSKLRECIQATTLRTLEKDCKKIGKNSVLLDCSSQNLQDFKLHSLNIQVETSASFLYKVIDTSSKYNEKINAVLLSLLLRCRNIQMSRLHHIVAQVLIVEDLLMRFVTQLLLNTTPEGLASHFTLKSNKFGHHRILKFDKYTNYRIQKVQNGIQCRD